MAQRHAGIQRETRAIAAFRCLGDACPDTCCRRWSMQLDAATENKYRTEAPELLSAVEHPYVPEASALPAAIMRRDPVSDVCVKFEDGWCGIHRDYGSGFLGDACHFYPRILRKFGDALAMTATLSCPETARLMLTDALDEPPLEWRSADFERLPHAVRDYAPEHMGNEAITQLQDTFLQTSAEAGSPKLALLQLHSAAQSLDAFVAEQWPDMAPMALKFALSRVPAPELHPADVPNLLLALCGLMQAASRSEHPRLRPLTRRIEALLDVKVTWEGLGLQVSPLTNLRLAALSMRVEMLPWLGGFLTRWLQAQLNIAAFPFSGFGVTLADRAVILGIRMATLTLAILARADEPDFGPLHAVEEAQILARFMDHLAEPEYSMQIYTETGWTRPARLRALLEAMGL